jgi:hypothetical protein
MVKKKRKSALFVSRQIDDNRQADAVLFLPFGLGDGVNGTAPW